jgi:Polysaccharide lyase family 4, domain II
MVGHPLHDSNRTLIAAIVKHISPAVERLTAGLLRLVILGAATIQVAGCDREGEAATKRASGAATPREALAATPGFSRQTAPYAARALDSAGRATGSVEIDGPPPLDSVIQPTADQAVCGVSFTRRSVEHRGNRAVGVIVWIDGLRSGKPLPVERRFEIANDRCLLVPELQAAIAGGTLNVRNLDAVEHRTRITRRAGGEELAIIRETDEGQVVPNERVLAKSGVLELTCIAHPWTHGWIAVFDHPYFTTTGTDGSFVIDSVPPGRYQLHAWHPRLGAMEEMLTIEAGKSTAITLRARSGT